MRRFLCLILAAAAVAAPAQKFIPKTIQFHGAPEYTDQELMTAAGLKKGELLDYAGMNERSKQLLSTGVFATLAFKFDGQDLVFTLTPSTELVPARLVNLPTAPGVDIDSQLRKLVPLYHGKVPMADGLMESVRAAIEKILAGEGINAQVTAMTGVNLATQKINEVQYSIASPPVVIGKIGLSGVSAALAPDVEKALAEAAKAPFDTANSTDGLRGVVEQVYHDRGYAAVKVEVAAAAIPMVSPAKIEVPFSISVAEGRIYRLASIQLPADAPLTDDEVNRFLADRPGAPPQGVRIRSVWEALSGRYKAKGYLDCRIAPHAALDDTAATVSYKVDVVPGPVYHLGFVKFDNVSDQMRTMLMRYWQMLPGDVFDQSYVAMFIPKAMQQDPTLQHSLAGVKVNFDVTEDQLAHTVNVVLHLAH
jgi:outer membrane protein assembly factor BamA